MQTFFPRCHAYGCYGSKSLYDLAFGWQTLTSKTADRWFSQNPHAWISNLASCASLDPLSYSTVFVNILVMNKTRPSCLRVFHFTDPIRGHEVLLTINHDSYNKASFKESHSRAHARWSVLQLTYLGMARSVDHAARKQYSLWHHLSVLICHPEAYWFL